MELSEQANIQPVQQNLTEKEDLKKPKRKGQDRKRKQNPSEKNCNFFIVGKQRYCNLEAVEGSQYCIHHKAENNGEKRIPCPLDPRHSIYEKDLQKHINKKCPSIRTLKEQAESKFYKKDINKGSDDEGDTQLTSEPVQKQVATLQQYLFNSDESTKKEELYTPALHLKKQQKSSPLALLSNEELQSLIKKVEAAYDKYVSGNIHEEYLVYSSCEHLIPQSKGNKKHVTQEASIIGHLEKQGLLKDPLSKVFVEFGCGKAQLSFLLRESFQGKTQHILIDKKRNFQNKPDKNMPNKEGFKRISSDIRDLDLSGIDQCVGKPLVGFSKHLCGEAADLTCRCVANTLPMNNEENNNNNDNNNNNSSNNNHNKSMKDVLQGLLIANCCHHRCSWSTYINKPFILNDVHMTPREFKLMCLMSSWAVAFPLDKLEEQEAQFQSNSSNSTTGELYKDLSPKQKSTLGFKCKRIIDTGRVLFMRTKGYESSLVYFVDREISPENCLMICNSISSQ